tara:strand:+ start:115 stop:705 length:591 start_codon:yes stop_codon:yes gene_type:complete
MRKRNLIFPLVASSLFMPSIEALERTTDLNSLEHENNIYEEVDILIAEGGSGKKSKEQQENLEKNKEKAKEAAKKRINKKINEQKKKADNIDPNASFQEWTKQLFEIDDRIADLKDFLDEIQEFIDYSIEKYNEISSEYNDGELSLYGIIMLRDYVEKFREISDRSNELGLTENDEIKALLTSLDGAFGKIAKSFL